MVTVYISCDFDGVLNQVLPKMGLRGVESPGDFEQYRHCTGMDAQEAVAKVGVALLAVAKENPDCVFTQLPDDADADNTEYEEVKADTVYDILGEYGLKELSDDGIEMVNGEYQPIGGWEMPGLLTGEQAQARAYGRYYLVAIVDNSGDLYPDEKVVPIDSFGDMDEAQAAWRSEPGTVIRRKRDGASYDDLQEAWFDAAGNEVKP